ncbi:hypothetical protein M2102_001692 [Fusobacterium sp. PH5-7]|uniref:hypothetical protein n=1 Tax=Fusobacterium sp. PH5-7 TaxID=2940528 RepID=UPI002474CC07|nr:hypothetical protein [Fusobacterium sp. PH5-7]MDH6458057.1 hypothetical protein [Fusobacterium sp. PH5-7]
MKEKLMIFLIGIILFTSCGSKEPVYEVRYIDGAEYMYDSANNKKVTGTVEEYIIWRDGGRTVTTRAEFKNGILNGKYEEYTDGRNPRLKKESIYKNGVLHGTSIEYYIYGNSTNRKRTVMEYKNGNIVNQKEYDYDQNLESNFVKEKDYTYKEFFKDGKRTKLAILDIYDSYEIEKLVSKNPKTKPKDLYKLNYKDGSGKGVKFYSFSRPVGSNNVLFECRIDENTDDPDFKYIVNMTVPGKALPGFSKHNYSGAAYYYLSGREFDFFKDRGYIVVSGSISEDGKLKELLITSNNSENSDYITKYGENEATFGGFNELSEYGQIMIDGACNMVTFAYNEAMKNQDKWYNKNKF